MSTKTNPNKKLLKALEEKSGMKLTLGNLLLSIRQGEEMSQVAFAELLGVSRQYLCDLEHNRRFVSPKVSAEYASTLGYSEHQFVKLCLQDMLDRDGLRLLINITPLKNKNHAS